MHPLLPVLGLVALVGFAVQRTDAPSVAEQFGPETPLQHVLLTLGDAAPDHLSARTADPEQVRRGADLVLRGRTLGPDGGRTAAVSKHYVCTNCHNLDREDPDLTVSDPEARLPYVRERGLPLLQGSTLWGVVNRERWYNDDYVRKYGAARIADARARLRAAVELCAVECAQGRPLAAWEADAILTYLWTLEYTLADLELSANEYARLNADRTRPDAHPRLIDWLKTHYLQKSPAHFYEAPADKRTGYAGLTGDPDAGRAVYESSCLHCHQPKNGVSHYALDNQTLSFRDLRRTLFKNSHFSLYQIIPYGTYALPGHRPYMPHFPAERMSRQQVEDLRAYVERRASEG